MGKVLGLTTAVEGVKFEVRTGTGRVVRAVVTADALQRRFGADGQPTWIPAYEANARAIDRLAARLGASRERLVVIQAGDFDDG